MKRNFENRFVHGFCNVALSVAMMVVFLCCFFITPNYKAVGNSEYNGTIYAGNKESKKISLMINVYWGNEFVENMLEILKQNNIKTTFFVGGIWAEENHELLKRIVLEGHEIGNHGNKHKEHGKISYEQNYEEIKNCHEIVNSITGISMELFAPPGGSYSKNTTQSAFELGYKTIMWTRDTIDWRDRDAELIFERATKNMASGDLVLMHPTKCTVMALPKIIEHAKSLGLKISPVSEVLGLV